MLTVITWLWRSRGSREYRAEHVNALARQFKMALSVPHKFVCITEERRADFSDDVTVYPTPKAAKALAGLQTLEGNRFPSCFRRLWAFSPDAAILGDRFLIVDIDLVLTANIDHLVDYDDPFVGWRPLARWGDKPRIGGGLYLMSPGAHPEVWEDFDGRNAIMQARAAGYRGSDQAWMSYKLAESVPTFDDDAGIYSIRDLADGAKPLPSDACLVQFNGIKKPWHSTIPWVRKYWNPQA